MKVANTKRFYLDFGIIILLMFGFGFCRLLPPSQRKGCVSLVSC